jgi:ABC-type proline/glycine betaine transport system ATPase subunit
MFMLDNARKIHLIEEVIKLEDKNILKELESVLQKTRTKKMRHSPKQKFLNELKESIQEVSLAKQGKIKLQSAKDFLNEL